MKKEFDEFEYADNLNDDKIVCANCGESLELDEVINTTCLKCGGEIK